MKDATSAPPLDVPLAPPALGATAEASEPWAEPVLTLPRDHPAWQRDALSISARVRAILARLRPVAVRVLSFWDHAIRSVAIAGRQLEIDPSGSYRLR